MNALVVLLNTVILAIGITIIGVSSASIAKRKKGKTSVTNIAYWYSILGLGIALILVSTFLLMGTSVMFKYRDTYLE